MQSLVESLKPRASRWWAAAVLVCVAGLVPVQTLAQAQRVVVMSAQAGLFGGPGDTAGPFVSTTVLPLADGQAFGWRIVLKPGHGKAVRVREELTLPAEPKTWGDPEPGLKRRTSPDGRTATTELLLQPVNGVIESSWTVTTGDPKGTWVLKLWVEDQPERVFRLQAR